MYNSTEANLINTLPWYQDQELFNLIQKIFNESSVPYNTIIDLCSGTSIYAPYFELIFKKYIGIEQSLHMFKKVQEHTYKLNISKINLINSDIIYYIHNNLTREENISHFFIKNALQFFNARELVANIKNSCSSQNYDFIVINTINNKKCNFFSWLKLDFMNRSTHFYSSEEIRAAFETNNFSLNQEYFYYQYIDFIQWLNYHNVSTSTIYNSLKKIENLSLEQRSNFGISKKNNKFFLERKQYLCSFSYKNS